MPVYEYKCTNCDEQFEITQKITDEPVSICGQCGGEMKRLITNTSFLLKGSGWYVTDYPSADRKRAIEVEKSAISEKADKKADSKREEAVASK